MLAFLRKCHYRDFYILYIVSKFYMRFFSNYAKKYAILIRTHAYSNEICAACIIRKKKHLIFFNIPVLAAQDQKCEV